MHHSCWKPVLSQKVEMRNFSRYCPFKGKEFIQALKVIWVPSIKEGQLSALEKPHGKDKEKWIKRDGEGPDCYSALGSWTSEKYLLKALCESVVVSRDCIFQYCKIIEEKKNAFRKFQCSQEKNTFKY